MNAKNSWDSRFSSEEYVYGTQPNDFLVASIHHLPSPGGEVLCLAEGEGRNAVYLAKRGYAVTAVDSSAVGLAKAEKLAAAHSVKITTVICDLAEFSLQSDRYDAIISIFCHLPPAVRKRLFAQLPASLREGGVFLLEGYTPKQLEYKTGGPPVAELMVTLAELKQELSPLSFLHGIELDREIHEGSLHHGLGAVAQVIATRKD